MIRLTVVTRFLTVLVSRALLSHTFKFISVPYGQTWSNGKIDYILLPGQRDTVEEKRVNFGSIVPKAFVKALAKSRSS